jgi:hypothetical protein
MERAVSSTKLTPNSIRRPDGVRLKLERSTDGLYVVKNAYVGHYEFFKGRPLAPQEGSSPKRKTTA